MLRDYTAGDPMREDVRWTNLTRAEIAQRLKDAGTPVSVTVVKQLLRKHRYVQRKAQKSQTMGQHADRNQQFERVDSRKVFASHEIGYHVLPLTSSTYPPASRRQRVDHAGAPPIQDRTPDPLR